VSTNFGVDDDAGMRGVELAGNVAFATILTARNRE